MQIHKPAAIRRAQILNAAVKLAVKHGYANVTRDMVAAECKISGGLLYRYFSTMTQLKRDVIRHAAANAKEGGERALLVVLAQGLAMKDKHALKAPELVRKAAAATL